MEFIPTVEERIQRYKLEAFSFVGDHPFVYLHCKVKICNASDPNSRCAQGCLHDRRKRSLYSEETNDEEYNLAQGPFILSDEETEALETLNEVHDAENYGKFYERKDKNKENRQIKTNAQTNKTKKKDYYAEYISKVRCDMDHNTH